jgi:hypothetical protein
LSQVTKHKSGLEDGYSLVYANMAVRAHDQGNWRKGTIMEEKPRLRSIRHAIYRNFDLITIYASDEQAERALQELRNAGFTKEEAVIIRGNIQIEALERRERAIAIWGLILTEVIISTVLGTIIGWIAGLYLFPLTPSLSTAALLIGLGCGGVVGIAVGLIEWWRWSNRRAVSDHRILIGVRVADQEAQRGSSRPKRSVQTEKLARLDAARRILESHGGLAIDSI